MLCSKVCGQCEGQAGLNPSEFDNIDDLSENDCEDILYLDTPIDGKDSIWAEQLKEP